MGGDEVRVSSRILQGHYKDRLLIRLNCRRDVVRGLQTKDFHDNFDILEESWQIAEGKKEELAEILK